MMRRIGHLTLAVGILLSWCGDLSCAVPIPPKGPQEQYAVFIGVDDPSAPAPVVPRLRHIADVVSNQYGYRRSNIVEIYNEKASLDSIRQAVGRISSAVSPSDSLFVVVALPTAHTADDVVAVPFNGDPAKPWTVLFTNDFAQWFAKNTAGQIAAIFPACAGHSKASFYAFEELRYTRSRMGTMQIASVCEESGPGPMSNLIDLLSNALSSSTGRLDLTGVMETAPAKIGQLSVIDVGELRPFYFTPQQNKLQPLIDVVKNGTDSKRRVSAIQEIVAAVNAEPTDRRATLVAAASAPLAATIGDADKSVRLTAIWAAGIVGLTSLSPRLASQFLSTNDEDEKRAIITALNNLKSGEVLSVIRRGLEDQSAAVRIATLRAGSVVRDDAVAKRTLSLGTGDPDPAVRAAVLQVLPGMSVPDQVKIQTTESALNDPSAIVRRQAVATWAELKQPATPALLTMLQSDPDSDVRQAVAYAIGRVQLDPANLDTVVTRLTTVVQSPKQQTRVREAAAWSLGRVGGEKAQTVLIRIAGNAAMNGALRAAAAESLGFMKSKPAVPALIAASKNESLSLRQAAIEALGEIADERALDAVLTALADKDPQVRTLASAALNKIHPKAGSLDVLLANLRDEKAPTVRVEAAQKLAAFRTPDVAQQLVRRLADPEPQVRNAVITSLSTFTDEPLRDVIRAALKNADPRVQEGAVVVAGMQGLKDQKTQITAIAANVANPPSLRAEAVRAAPRVEADPAVVFSASRDLDPIVREASVDALRMLQLDRSVDELKRLSLDDTPAVREKAILALRSYPSKSRKD